jgi:hypothetical protein
MIDALPPQQTAVVKDLIVKSLSESCHDHTIIKKNSPEKKIVHILLDYVDDDSFVERYDKTVGAIAREGLERWKKSHCNGTFLNS